MTFVFILLFLLLLIMFGPLGPNAATWITYSVFTFCYIGYKDSTKPGAKRKFWIYFTLAQLTLVAWAIYEGYKYSHGF